MIKTENENKWRTFGNKYMKESFAKEKKKILTYSKSNLLIGRKSSGAPYYLDLREACRIILIGATRSGKTFAIRSMCDRINLTNKHIIFLNDCKNEFYSSRDEVQGKFRNLLFEDEQPRGMKVVTLRPTFFKTIISELPDYNFWFSIDFRDFTRSDFMTMMNSGELTNPQRVIVELLYQELQNRFKRDKNVKFSLDLINEIIEDMEDITSQQKTSMKFKFRPLEHSHFYEEQYDRNIVKLLQRDYVVSINMENFDSFGKGNFLFPEVVLSVVARKVIMARRAKKIKEVWIVIDEAPRFLGVNKQTSIKDLVNESFMLDTRYGVNYIIASQTYNIIPPDMKENSRYIFVPRSVDVSVFKDILNDTGLTRNIQSANNDAIRMKRLMNSIPFSWLVIDKSHGTKDVITFSAPLSRHIETGQ